MTTMPPRKDPPQTGEGNVDPLSGEPVEMSPDVDPADADGATPGDEPFPEADEEQAT